MAINQEIEGPNGKEIKSLTRAKAIKERCLNCVDWDKKRVKNCKTKDCPLWQFQNKAKKKKVSGVERTKYMKEYCSWCINGSGKMVSKCVTHSCPIWPFRLGNSTDREFEAKK